MVVAEKYLGLKVEHREVLFDEVKDFAECGLCGTAAVISPVGKIVDHGKEICFPSGMDEMGPVTKKLRDTHLQAFRWAILMDRMDGFTRLSVRLLIRIYIYNKAPGIMLRRNIWCFCIILHTILCGIIRRFVLKYSYMYANVYKSLE